MDMYNKGMSNRDIVSNMPGRNYQYISNLGWGYRSGNLDALLRGEKRTRLSWTDEEKKTMLRLLDANASRKVLCSSFPGRSAYAIQIMVCKPRGDPSWGKPCKPRLWTLTDDTILRESAAQGHSPRDLMQPLNRSIRSIWSRARLLGLTLRRDMYSPKEEEDLIRWNADGIGAAEIATKLGRSVASVETKMTRLAPTTANKSNKSKSLRLSPSDVHDVEVMIDRDISWDVIQQQKFPLRTM